MSILILGGATDPESLRVVEELEAEGAYYIHLDTANFPESVHLSFLNRSIYLGREKLDVPHVVYLRGLACHPLRPGLAEELSSRPQGVLAECAEKRAMLESVVMCFQRRGARIVNSLQANAQHSQKPYQLALLKAKKLPVPKSLAANDPKAVRQFVHEVGKAVYKPLAGGAGVQLLQKWDLSDERLATLAAAPVLFQEYIEGVPVRAYVVGQHAVAAAELHSPEVDHRRQEDSVEATRLSTDERAAVLAAARVCRMHFAGVDLVRYPGGFKIIECNPSPMFAVFEQKTGQNVARPLAAYLIECHERKKERSSKSKHSSHKDGHKGRS